MLTRIFPFLSWFKKYGFGDLRADLISGLTVALVLIPQSMAYAQLAGLPSFYGLYASFLPPMTAALFGSSRQLATGPVAVVSLMTAASLEPLATAGGAEYIAYAVLLALIVGIFQFSLGLLRLGLVVNFLSHPVVNGFTNAAAIIIATSQLSKLFGVFVDKAEHHYETVIAVAGAALHYTHWPTLAMGVLAFAVMYGMKRTMPRFPNVLAAVRITTLISWAAGFDHNAKTPLARIASPETHGLVLQFNEALEGIPPLAEKRAGLSRALEEAKKKNDAIAVMQTKHEAAVTAVRIARLKEKIHLYRSRIRALLFEGAREPDGKLRLYPRGGKPAGARGDNRTWRIKVAGGPIDTSAVIVTGGGAVVGFVPRGLPALKPPPFDFSILLRLLPFAAIISLLGFMEAISIAKAMAGKTGQRIDPNQELIGQGLANILGSLGQSYPTSGSFSRSAVNLQAGAASGLSSVFTSLAVVVVLFFFTPLLYHLPQSVLAAVIMMAVIGLLNVSGFVHAWKTQPYDGMVSVVTFACTLAFAPHLDRGIMAGVVLSLAGFLYKSMRPKVASLSRDADQALRCAGTYGLEECDYIAMIRFDGPLFFANSNYLEDRMMELLRTKKKLKHVLLVCNGINDIDATGEETLSLLVDRVRSAGVDFSLSGVNESVMKVLRRTHFLEKLGEDHIYSTMERAVSIIHGRTHTKEEAESCPLISPGRRSVTGTPIP